METDQPANDDSTNQQSVPRQNDQVRVIGRDEMTISESENYPCTIMDSGRSYDDDTAAIPNSVAVESDNNNIVSLEGYLDHGNVNMAEQAGNEAQHFDSSESSSGEGESSDSESSAGDDSEDEHDNKNDGLSDYERLRLRNIQRNEARLAQLGLLTKAAACSANTTNIGDSGGTGTARVMIGSIQQSQQPRKKKKTVVAAPLPRRSLPPRRCAKLKRKKSTIARSSSSIPFRERGSVGSSMIESECDYDSDEFSLTASPIKIRRTLRPQPHQEQLDENHLKHYLKTRRARRGRPKREEYVYACDERCKECGGEWKFDNNTGENDENDEFGVYDGGDLEERTRLIRCKDCRGAFHLSCMLVHGKHIDKDDGSKPAAGDVSSAFADDARVEDLYIGGEDKENHESRNLTAVLSEYTEADAKKEKFEKDRMSTSADIDTFEESCSTRDPKRCHRCEVKRRAQQKNQPRSSPSVFSHLLEAIIGRKTVQVRVTPKSALEANTNGKVIMCYVTLRGVMNDTAFRSGDTSVNGKRKVVTWGSPLEDVAKEDVITRQLRKLIDKALSDVDHARLQDYSCAALRKRIFAGNHDGGDGVQTMATIAATAVRLGGIRMLAASMRHHPDRPTIQAEAMCTLSEITWICPHLGIETINRNVVDDEEGSGCLDLAIAAMERHGVHSKVQQLGCGYLRALSYDVDCCTRLKESRAVATVVDSIRRNPRKANVVMEGR